MNFKEITSWAVTIMIAFVVAQLITNYVVVNANIPSESMENTVMTGDRLLANRLAYINSDPQRGDIVVFKYPVDKSTLYIKRIIGLPGDKIDIIDGKIYINDSSEPLEEDYLPEEWTILNDGLTYTVPENCYFMLGDNRNHSSDSRFWRNEAMIKGMDESVADLCQFVQREDILGKAMIKYWPLSEVKTF